jgi:hypothetical protein
MQADYIIRVWFNDGSDGETLKGWYGCAVDGDTESEDMGPASTESQAFIDVANWMKDIIDDSSKIKTLYFSMDVITALRNLDADEINDIQCDAKDTAGMVYERYYKDHPEVDQLPEFAIDENGITGFAPAVDAAMAVYEQAIK